MNYKFGLGLSELHTAAEKKFVWQIFIARKGFVIEFQGESLEQFLSYRAHFQRYQHFRGFWQSTATSSRSCLKYHYLSPHLELENDWNQSSSIPLADRQFVPPHLQEFV